MRRIVGNTFVFQQDSVPAHRDRETVPQLIQQETPDVISPDLWPPNSPDLNPVDCRICGLMQKRVFKKTPLRDTMQRLEAGPHWRSGQAYHKTSSTKLLEKRLHIHV